MSHQRLIWAHHHEAQPPAAGKFLYALAIVLGLLLAVGYVYGQGMLNLLRFDLAADIAASAPPPSSQAPQ